MREIILDTETTGFDPDTGDRLVEIGAVEMIDGLPTGETFHVYINPERDMPESAFNVHGLSEEFLSTKPKFIEIAAEFIRFIADSKLVIHNASFDMKFINFELKKCKLPAIDNGRIIDTLEMARRKHAGQKNSLDALAVRYGIDNSARVKHGALLDAEILTEVYIEMNGGRQKSFGLNASDDAHDKNSAVTIIRKAREKRAILITNAEIEAHEKFVASLKKPLWNLYKTQ